MKKLYVKNDNGDYEELQALVIGHGLTDLKKVLAKDAIDKYINVCTSNKCIKNQNSEKLYFLKLSNYLESVKIKYINDVTPVEIDSFENILLKKTKVSSVNRRFNTFKNFFRKCVEWGYILKSPCEGMRKRREENNPRKPWPLKVFKLFISRCDGNYKNIFNFLWLTGCRPMELKNLKWSDINYDQKEITLRCGKNAEVSRKFPLTKEIDKLIHSIKVDSLFVFSENKKQVNNDSLYHYCRTRLNDLSLTGFTVYGIRHGFGTRLAKQGVSAFYIAELMGHSKIETTRRYVHSDKIQLIQILSKAK